MHLALGATGARFIYSSVYDRFCFWTKGVHGAIVLHRWLRWVYLHERGAWNSS